MIADLQLHRIRTGEATAKEARAIIREFVTGSAHANDQALYAALRGWTWKAMQARRFDEELSDWFDVLRGASKAISRKDEVISLYIQVLAHLVDDSLRYAKTHNSSQLLYRSHVGEILDLVSRNNGRIARDRLIELTGLTDSRLSQLLRELTIAGALERQQEGRQARFILTDTGRELLEAWVSLRQTPSEPYESENAPSDDGGDFETWAARGEVLHVAAKSGQARWDEHKEKSHHVARPQARAIEPKRAPVATVAREISEESWPGYALVEADRSKEPIYA